MLRALIICFTLLCSLILNAQHESDNWPLVFRRGISPKAGQFRPSFFNSEAGVKWGGISAISDDTGFLYAYAIADTIRVWNGASLSCYKTIPNFGKSFFVTLNNHQQTWIIARSNTHKGFVCYKINKTSVGWTLDTNTVRFGNFYRMSDDFQIILNATQNEYWIVSTASLNSLTEMDRFIIYKFDINGVDTLNYKVIQIQNTHNVNSVIRSSNNQQYIVISKMATGGLFSGLPAEIHIYSFDQRTGMARINHIFNFNNFISTYFHIRSIRDIEFSPLDSMIYLVCNIHGPPGTKLIQLRFGDLFRPTIHPSMYTCMVDSISPFYPRAFYVELGNDCKIYIGNLSRDTNAKVIDAVVYPELLGNAASFRDTFILTTDRFTDHSMILPEFPSFYKNIPIHNISAAPRCVNSPTRIAHRDTLRTDSIRWNFGDPASGVLNSALGNVVYHTYARSGTYLLTAFLFKGTSTDTQRLSLRIDTLAAPFLGNDTALCSGASLVLRDRNGFPGLPLWSDSSFYDSLPVHRPGTYWYALDNGCGRFYDTLRIDSLLPPSLSLGNDTALCRDTLTLNATWPLSTYFWNTGATDSIIRTAQSGQYRVTVSNPCGIDSGAQRITFFDSLHFSLGSDTAMCIGDRFALLANVPGAQGFLWFNGNTSASALINTPGQYWLRAVNLCGAFTDTLRVDTLHPPRVDLGPDTILCKNGLLLLNATQTSPAQYNWHNGSKDPYTFVYDSGRFWVVVNNACGMHSDSIDIDDIFPPDILLGMDTAICSGDTLLLAVNVEKGSYLWHNGSTDSLQNAGAFGFYWVIGQNICGRDSAGIHIRAIEPVDLDLPPKINLCQGNTYTLNAGSDLATYRWSTGDTDSLYTLRHAGSFSVTVSNPCGSDSALVDVDLIPLPRALPNLDTVLCPDRLWQVYLPAQNASFLWNTGDTSQGLLIDRAGVYTASIRNPCGEASTRLNVQYALLPDPQLPVQTAVCPNASLVLKPDVAAEDFRFLWSTGDSSHSLLVSEPGRYTLSLTDPAGCIASFDIQVISESCDKFVFAPNAFTPNGNFINEQFRLFTTDPPDFFDLRIFDRWGEQIFSTSDANTGWDGTRKGLPMPQGSYVWLLRMGSHNQPERWMKGQVLLIR